MKILNLGILGKLGIISYTKRQECIGMKIKLLGEYSVTIALMY